MHWLENIRDWCISRQLLVGDTGFRPATAMNAGRRSSPGRHAGRHVRSADAQHSASGRGYAGHLVFLCAVAVLCTLGWPDESGGAGLFLSDGCTLVTGYDIIFFWVARMVFSGYEHTGKGSVPHGVHPRPGAGFLRPQDELSLWGTELIRWKIIDQYGADALRMTLVTGNAPGNDMRFYNERVEASRNFANKVWNASRFIMMNLGDKKLTQPADFKVRPADRWIMSKCNNLVKDVTENMDKFELGIALSKIYDFIWDEFCDWYIEIAKYRIYHADEDPESANDALWTLREVLKKGLKAAAPVYAVRL